MTIKKPNMRKILPLLIILMLLVPLAPLRSAASQAPAPDEARITDFLNDHPLLAHAEVLQVTILRGGLVINLSEAFLPDGAYQAALFNQLQDDLDQAFNINQRFMTTFLVEGHPLEVWGHPLPDYDDVADPPGVRELPGDGPLAGIKIALSPGHGLYWNEYWSAWFYQRAVWYGLREDIVNAQIMRYVQAALMNQGATVIQLRELDFNARTGVTGYPAWHEAARQYAIAQGLPDWIYNNGSNNYNSDIRARPIMANTVNADILISLHNNGWNGTYSGTETYYDTHNHPGSLSLAKAVHNSIIHAIHTHYDPGWVNGGVKSTTHTYGEIRLAHMPAVLIELAYLDRQFPDNAYLHDEAFKQLAAHAITQGICDFWGVTCEDVSITLPQVLEVPTLSPAYGDGMCDSGWYRFPNPRGQYAYLALNASDDQGHTNQATWQPQLPISGEYRLAVFIPQHPTVNWDCPQKVIQHDTGRAHYEILHANGVSTRLINQAQASNQWVDLGIFHFNHETQAAVMLTNVTGEPHQTTSVAASAMRFTLVGHAGTQFYNTPWLDQSWLTDESDTPVENIRNFLNFHHSCLSEPIVDVDGQQIDLPTLLHQAALEHQVNPKALLAIMEAEQDALSQCPDKVALANLMGRDPATTAHEQITKAAATLRHAIDHLAQTGETPNGWRTHAPMGTQDGVSVIPANDAITVLFDFTPYAGSIWGGSSPDKNGVHAIYIARRDFVFINPLPQEIFQYYHPLTMR